MQVTYLGHASFSIKSDGKTIFVDPWLNGPTSPIKVGDVTEADLCLVTHDHGDHGYAEAVEICKKTGATFVAINELALKAKEDGVENVHTLNIGGSVEVGGVTVTLVQAFHSSTLGTPTGFIVKLPSGTFYHPGDTGLFYDMKLFGELYDIDLFFVPIGSYYVMGIKEAVKATELVGPKVVIPMHFDTFPAIAANPKQFYQKVTDKGKTKVEIMKPGETKEIDI
ncbi:MAG: metal-dependent hydrolase [Candidatus Thorarchaeota archaeon]|nr:metal-dependent hydrolase [Candidatus Thorarchaeota archaeon]